MSSQLCNKKNSSRQLSSEFFSPKDLTGQLSSQLCYQKNSSRQLSSQLFGEKLSNFSCQFLWFLGRFWSIIVNFGQLWSIMVNYRYFYMILNVFLVTFSVFLVNFWSIICQFLSNIWQFVPQFLYRMFGQFNYLLKYCWKSIVKSIIFSIIAWCGLVKPGFESSLNPSLNSEGEGLSRVWTQAYNWPIWGSVSGSCPCPGYTGSVNCWEWCFFFFLSLISIHSRQIKMVTQYNI